MTTIYIYIFFCLYIIYILGKRAEYQPLSKMNDDEVLKIVFFCDDKTISNDNNNK